MIKSSISIRIFFLLVIILSFNTILTAEWLENNSFGIGNLSFASSGGTHGYFLEIPDSQFMIYYKKDNFIVFDVNESKIRGGRLMSPGSYNDSFCVMPDPVSGWNLFYFYNNENTKERKNGKLHIDPYGQFGEDSLLMDDPSKVAVPIGVPERSQVWFLADKILRLNIKDDSWSEFNYPEDWDTNSSIANTFQNLTYDSMIIISYTKTNSEFQALILNIVTGEAKLITAEKGFFDHKVKIEGWNSHPDQYIIMKNTEIYSYDSQTNKIELLMKDFGFEVFSIMQDESGRKLYVLRSTALYVLDLIDKTVEAHEIPLQEGFVFYTSGLYDPTRKKIIAALGISNFGDRIFGIINLEDFSIKYIENLNEDDSYISFFLEEENSLILLSGSNNLRLINLESDEIKNFIPIMYIASSWNIIDDLNKPILLDNQSGSDFIRILPDNSRELNNAGISSQLACQFPDGKKAIIGEYVSVSTGPSTGYSYYNYKKYDFEEKVAQQIHIPFECHEFITDTKNDQIIGMAYTSLYNLVEFISPDNFVTSWFAPEELKLQNKTFLFDEQNSIFWVLFKNKDNSNLHFYKLSTKAKTLLDSFTLEKATFATIKSIACDPEDNFLYFIDETNNATQRDLAILDINKREIFKRITLQKEVKNGFVTTIAIPGIIPVPERDRLFIWDHYGAWSIDTNSWEVLYGEAKNNPTVLGFRSINEPDMNGKYIEDKNQVLIVDRNNKVFEVDFDTGNVIKEISLPYGIKYSHITKEKDKILFLNDDTSAIQTLHLNPAWDTPATFALSTNYIQFGSGDNAKFNVNIKNPYDFEQKVTAYIWLYAPDGTMLFFSPTGLTFDIAGIPLTLPANCDVTGDILSFTMPAGVPEGFYNFNAVFVNENGDRGPIGTWNFYVRD